MGFIWFLIYGVFWLPLAWALGRAALGNLEDEHKSVNSAYWIWRIVVAVVGTALASVLHWGLSIGIESAWFNSLGYGSRFWTAFGTKMVLFIIGASVFFVVGVINTLAARRVFIQCVWRTTDQNYRKNERARAKKVANGTSIFGIVFFFIIGIGFGYWLSSHWQLVLMYLHQTPTDVVEPVFNRTLGFYLFSFPYWRELIFPWIMWAAISQAVVILLLYIISYSSYAGDGLRDLKTAVIDRAAAHLTTLLGFFMVFFCLYVDMSKYRILYAAGERFFGAGYAEIHYGLPVIKTYVILLSILSALLFIFGWTRHFGWEAVARFIDRVRTWKVVVAVAIIIVIFILPLVMKPILTANVVNQNEKALERPYIISNMASTAEAYGLGSNVRVTEMGISEDLTAADIEANPLTISNIRLWDWRMLKTWFGQDQGLRSFYTFSDVDLDRYTINGVQRQVMLAPRELDTNGLLANVPGSGWVNEHFEYTHGFGSVAAVVNEFLTAGAPKLLVQNIPLQVAEGLPSSNPRIYFSQTDLVDIFALPADTKSPTELDYMSGAQGKEEIIRTVYDGADGLRLGSCNIFSRLAFVNKYGIRAMLWTTNTADPDTRVLMRRNISDRVSALAPFLSYDADPYIVYRDGLPMVYIWDAYTLSDMYPYSQPSNGFNYIRNSVKVVIDVYNGTVDFYIFDEEDPIIQTLAAAFPGMFKSQTEMPQDLQQHIRYPEDLYTVQLHIYDTYHVEDPDMFYNQADVWDLSHEEVGQETGTAEIPSYYVTIQLPGEDVAEYVLMNSFTPLTKSSSGGQQRINMVAWMVARCDPPNYGELMVFKFPSGISVKGTQQLEAEVDQNPEMSRELTLWNSGGSRVFKGNTLAIPLKRVNGEYTMIYVEPVFIQSTNSPKPQVTRVIFGTQKGTEWEETFQKAISKVLAKYYGAQETTTTQPTSQVVSGTPLATGEASLNQMIAEADAHLAQFMQLTGEGRLDEAGQELQRFFELWERIRTMTPQG